MIFYYIFVFIKYEEDKLDKASDLSFSYTSRNLKKENNLFFVVVLLNTNSISLLN